MYSGRGRKLLLLEAMPESLHLEALSLAQLMLAAIFHARSRDSRYWLYLVRQTVFLAQMSWTTAVYSKDIRCQEDLQMITGMHRNLFFKSLRLSALDDVIRNKGL